MNNLINTIISSGITSIIISCLLPFIFSLCQSSIEYKREFTKRFLDKSFETYEKIEKLLNYFSVAVIDNDGRYYHSIFSTEENPYQKEYLVYITQLTKANIYISDSVRDAFIDFNKFIIDNKINFNNIEDGKKFYQEIADRRDFILSIVKKDLERLYNGKTLKTLCKK